MRNGGQALNFRTGGFDRTNEHMEHGRHELLPPHTPQETPSGIAASLESNSDKTKGKSLHKKKHERGPVHEQIEMNRPRGKSSNSRPPMNGTESVPSTSERNGVHELLTNGAGRITQKNGAPAELGTLPDEKLQDMDLEKSTFHAAVSDGHLSAREKQPALSAERLVELTSTPESLPVRPLVHSPSQQFSESQISPIALPAQGSTHGAVPPMDMDHGVIPRKVSLRLDGERKRQRNLTIETGNGAMKSSGVRPNKMARAVSTPASYKSPMSPPKQHEGVRAAREAAKTESSKLRPDPASGWPLPSPNPIPLPPMSIPTHLQLEMSSHRPSPLFIQRSAQNDFPYESSRVKIERLLNFLFLPPHLEGVLWFGTLACLDAWLYTFTILPLRLLKSVYILGLSWVSKLIFEIQYVSSFVYNGTGRVWSRRGVKSSRCASKKAWDENAAEVKAKEDSQVPQKQRFGRHHHRTKSMPSTLMPNDKADMLKGLLIISTCLILLRLDASRMYHWIRGQNAIKLYVIYNVLEVSDRLFSAIGQDILECLFSREALERKPNGHSKVLRPFWLFMLALIYTVIHSTALFYQVITLNVAVNSYSNALITLLMSNQFVEIKSTVFKKFEKENLFQLTCADVVERFQLWHMLMIIAARNIVETGGMNIGISALSKPVASTAAAAFNGTLTQAVPPRSVSSILPRSFTLVPSIVTSLTAYFPTIGTVLGPFLVVLGSEMLVDWLKHAYISKFNNTRPAVYDRFLDILAKDYYTNAFGDPNLTKRLGLPVIPLSCLLIRASVQTYQMFMAAWVPSPLPSAATSLASIHEQYSAARASMPTTTTSAIAQAFDELINRIPSVISNSRLATHFTTILVVLLMFLVLLACKLVLGMVLLAFARSRYRSMKEREQESIHVEGGRRVGGWGVVEVEDDKRRWIYEDDPAALQALRDREAKEKAKRDKERDRGFSMESIDKVKRYDMVAKRIW